MTSPQADSAGRQGGPAYGRSWPPAGQVFAAARLGRRTVAAYVGTGCVGPLRTVRRVRRTVARALRRRRPPQRPPATFASPRPSISAAARGLRQLTLPASPTYSVCPSQTCTASASLAQV